jgi:curved DNA-binding protein CbpA
MTAFENFDLYEELEITKEASSEEIKKAYKKLAMRWHPDKNANDPSATEKFQRISHAYSILSDSKKKSMYDKYGTVDEDNWNFEEFMKNFQFDFIYDLFDENMFGPGKKGMFDLMLGGEYQSRHSMKLMYNRKKAYNMPWKKDSPHSHENINVKEGELPQFIYGNGKGLESTVKLQYWLEKPEDEDWETDDEEADNEAEEGDEGDDEEIEEIEDEDVLEIFIQDNSTMVSKNSFTCKYCEKESPQNFTSKTLKQHFIDTHKKEFEDYFGTDCKFIIFIK